MKMPFFLLNIWSLFWGNILSVTFPGFICTCSTAWMIISVSKWLITMVIISPLNYGCGTVGPLPNWPKCMARHKSKGDVTNLTTYPSKSKLHPPTLGHVGQSDTPRSRRVISSETKKRAVEWPCWELWNFHCPRVKWPSSNRHLAAFSVETVRSGHVGGFKISSLSNSMLS